MSSLPAFSYLLSNGSLSLSCVLTFWLPETIIAMFSSRLKKKKQFKAILYDVL